MKQFLFALLVAMMILPIQADAQENAVVSGTIVDNQTGEGLIGARVMIKGTSKGNISKMDGKFRIANIAPGEYSLTVTYIGYAKTEINNLVLKPGEIKKLEITLKSEAIMKGEVVVTAKKVMNTGATLLKERQKAEAVSDAIGAEEISRGGAGDAADAIKKVTGATTVGGKHVYIRGLGERYSSTQLNGANLPSADPDKKSVHLDLFPSDMIENIITTKTATPDKPGDFTGGTVNISTKSFPEKFKIGFSMSGAYNSATTGTEMLTYSGSQTDWLGYDDGARSIPEVINNYLPNDIPSSTDARVDADKAQLLDQQSKAFQKVFAPNRESAPFNGGISLNVGNQHEVFDRQLGYLATFSYNRKFTNHDELKIGNWSRSQGSAENLIPEYYADAMESRDEVAWGGMLNFAYNLTPNNKISMNFMHNQNGESSSIYQDGYRDYYQTDMETYILTYVERAMTSYQISGDHNLTFLNNAKIDWLLSFADNTQEEPNYRTFDTEYSIDSETGEKVYSLNSNDNNAYPSHYFRGLNEDLFSTQFNLDIPILKQTDNKLSFKTGFLYNEKNRDFNEKRFIYKTDPNMKSFVEFDGDPNKYMQTYAGISEEASSSDRYYFGIYIEPRVFPRQSYTASQTISAGYGMVDWLVLDKIRLVGGVRLESTDILTESLDTSLTSGEISEQDILPSFNLTYQISDNMNLRAAYGKTIARPTLREIAPYNQYMPIKHYMYLGNAELERSLIDNFDLRWEWFSNPGEILSVGGFYKNFTNPIELAIINHNLEHKPINVDQGILYGLELEFRKSLAFIELLKDFQFGMNVTLVHSEVDLPENEYNVRKQFDPDTEKTRELQGQSPYVVNFDLTYVNYNTGTEVNTHFNMFGKRLAIIGYGTPDYYEFPKPDLSFVVSQKFLKNFKAKLSIKNILDSKNYIASTYLDKEYVAEQYLIGRTISFGLSYTFQ